MDTDKERTESDDPWDADGGDELEAEIMRANRPSPRPFGEPQPRRRSRARDSKKHSPETPEGQTTTRHSLSRTTGCRTRRANSSRTVPSSGMTFVSPEEAALDPR